jgi:hypothetical protein
VGFDYFGCGCFGAVVQVFCSVGEFDFNLSLLSPQLRDRFAGWCPIALPFQLFEFVGLGCEEIN